MPPEYKELERALLSRMIRAGIIDGATFVSRVQALGYSPEDTKLMLDLEQKEGAKTLLLGPGTFTGHFTVPAYGSAEALSPSFSDSKFSYFIVSIDLRSDENTVTEFGIRWFDSAGNALRTDLSPKKLSPVGAAAPWTSFSSIFSPAAGTSTGKVIVRGSTPGSIPRWSDYNLKSLEGVQF